MAAARLRSEPVRPFRYSQPLPLGGDLVPLRRDGGGRAGGGLRAGHRLPAYRQAAVVVYDIADLVKFETVVPEAFRVAAAHAKGKLDRPSEMATRHACRDVFRRANILGRIIPLIEDVLSAGGLAPPTPPEDAVGPAFPDPAPTGDAGQRS